MTLSLKGNNDPPERGWADDDFTADEEGVADFNAGLTSLGFIRAAVRRNAWRICATAMVGWLIGLALFLHAAPVYQASTKLFLTNGPEAQPGAAVQDAQTIVESIPVAQLALNKLGLQESTANFLGSYTATPVTDRVLLITVSASSSQDATIRASALATEFLRYRAAQLDKGEQQLVAALYQQVDHASQQVRLLEGQIRRVSAQPPSPARQARLGSLQNQLSQANGALNVLKQNTYATQATAKATTASQVTGSQVLDAAAPIPPPSRLKHLILYPAVGLIAGLALALAVVVVRALTSDRLRRRDDVARALGAPVRLSVGAVRLSRWLPSRHGLAAARSTNVRRIVAHLRSAVSVSSRSAAALAVVPADDPQVAALSLVSLAVSYAQEGRRVIVADLARDAPAAELLGSRKPGVHSVNIRDAHLILAVPQRDDAVPIGPIGRALPHDQRSRFTAAVTDAYASADRVLTLASVDPSLGGDHLPTWATDVVVVVTAGRSSWTRIHAVGELVRLAGTRLVSGVLVGVDRTDESLGVVDTQGIDRDAAVREGGASF